ncbi:solute carrier family 22 member 13-like isoform X2 [Cottoperca gobio]|uniref:Solute carrier family 22 member 13-like isoform X2 n=1 Tax=Cottoperca gobio TaxID=56716 RepID=A0A6J2RKC2_COTGO|nr:solute carrier family 22 member 13-like isoform X2 [Cottoperca gobio]
MADFGEILSNIGEFGLFQKLTLFALCFPNVMQSFFIASFVFIQSDPERHCNTDWILSADSNLTTDELLNLTLPREEDGTFSRCQMFVPVDWDIGAIKEYGLNETAGCQNGWVYSNTLYDATIVTDFDLVCDKTNLMELIQTMFMAGVLVGSLIFGPFAESFGRKRATQIPAVIMFIFTVTAALCPNVYFLLVCQFLVGIGGGGYRVNCIILSTEWIGASKRSWGACVTQLFGALGQCILAGVIYFIRDWRLAQLITAAPLAVVAIYIWFIPESARWLLSRGRTEEAKQLIVKAAFINKRTVPDSLLEKIEIKEAVNKGGIQIIFKSSLLTRYFFVVAFGWFSLNLATYSLYLNMGSFGFNVFLTQFMFGAFEMLATLLSIWLLEVFGRRISLISTLLTGGLSCMFILAVPKGYAIAVTSLAVAARFFLIWSGPVCAVYMQELFPTSVRQTAMALGSLAARTGSFLAPMLNMLAVYHWSIPTAVFSSFTLVSGALVFLLPETRRKELPESADEAENKRNVTSTTTDSSPNQDSTKL